LELSIDHATVAGPDLRRMRVAFESIGLRTEYGGPHSNGVTQMASLGFDDGSYLELISTLSPGARSPLWDRQIRRNAGATAWAVEVEDVAAEAARLRGLGVPVEGPLEWTRETPDGRTAEWEMAFPGAGSPGAKIPFFLRDRTPRAWRVRPSPSVMGTELAGIDRVVLAVRNLDESSELFRRLYGWPPDQRERSPGWRARLAGFGDAPVVLAAPESTGGWLATRLEEFGELPCAFVIRTLDPDASAARFGGALGPAVESWFGRRMRWMDEAALGGARIGLVEAPA